MVRVFIFMFLIKSSCCSRMKIENKFPSPHLRLIKTWNFISGGIQYRAKWETGDITAVTSIQDRFFRGFTVSELFRCEHSTFPIIISFTKFSSSALPHFFPPPPPLVSLLRGTVSQPEGKFPVLYDSNQRKKNY